MLPTRQQTLDSSSGWVEPPLWELGQMLSYYLSLFKMPETSSILLVMIGLVLLVDMLSAKIRRMLS